MSELIKDVTDASFEADVLKADAPVLVDFWAPWCGPCKALAPTLATLAENYGGRLHVAKVNVDENSQLPAEYGVRSIPALVLIKEGKAVANVVGNKTVSELTSWINEHI